MSQATRLFLSSVLFFIFLTPANPVLAQNPDFIDIPLTSLYSNQSIQLNGLISSQNLDFTLPKNWRITEPSWLNIDVSASDLLDLSASSLTISLNGLQLTSLHLRDVVGSVRKIELPPNFFIPGKNVLSLEAILYLPNDIKTNCQVW